MGGLAALAREAGHRVTGCDANVYPPMSEQLTALGIELIDGYDADQLKLAPDLFVIGNAITRGNPLIEAILDANLPYTSGPQWLAEARPRRPPRARRRRHARQDRHHLDARLDPRPGAARTPGFLVGGVPLNFAVSARLGDVKAPFVIEADEYDTAFFDKRSKFVHYRPRTAILNNLEFDHADIFDDLAAIERQFHHLVRTVPRPRPARRQRPRRGAAARPGDGLLERGAALRRQEGSARHAARARRAARLRRAARRPEDRPRRLGAARRAQPAQRAGGDRRGRARRHRARGVGARLERFPQRAPAPRAARRRRRRRRLRRLRAPPDGHAHDHRRPAPQGRRGAHPRRLRAALEHHEARRDEGAAAVGARRSRSRVLLRRRPRLGRRRRPWRRWARAPSSRRRSTIWSHRVVAAPARATTCSA